MNLNDSCQMCPDALQEPIRRWGHKLTVLHVLPCVYGYEVMLKFSTVRHCSEIRFHASPHLKVTTHRERLCPLSFICVCLSLWLNSLLVPKQSGQKYTHEIQSWFQLLNIQLTDELFDLIFRWVMVLSHGTERGLMSVCLLPAGTNDCTDKDRPFIYLLINQNQIKILQNKTTDSHLTCQKCETKQRSVILSTIST